MSAGPLVSVIVPTFRRPHLLARAVRSVVAQTYTNLEILVVNDDESPLEVDLPDDTRIVVLRNERAKGACGARNTGLFASRGEYVTGLDDDDEFDLRRIAIMVCEYSSELSFIASNLRHVSRDGTSRSYFRSDRMITLNDLLWDNCVGSQVLTSRNKLVELGGFDESLASSQDWDMWIRLAERFGPGRRLSQALYSQYVDHGGQRISTGARKIIGMKSNYHKHLSLMTPAQRKWNMIRIKRYNAETWTYHFILSLFEPDILRFHLRRLMNIR